MKINLISQLKWLFVALIISSVLVVQFESNAFFINSDNRSNLTFLGFNLFLEIFMFIAFGIFVVFGIKGYFELYSNRISNVILSVSGAILFVGMLIMLYQVVLPN